MMSLIMTFLFLSFETFEKLLLKKHLFKFNASFDSFDLICLIKFVIY